MAGLVLVAPLVVIYELGALVLGPEVRNGADVWLRGLLNWMGFAQYLLPVLTVGILLAWHYAKEEPWRLSSGILGGMIVECILLALCLRMILELQGTVFQRVTGPMGMVTGRAAVLAQVGGTMEAVIGFLGAGVYEELLFRLALLPPVAWILRSLGAGRGMSIGLALVLTGTAFAAAHYVGHYGEPLELASVVFWFGYVFRFLAGVFFGLLFVYRGFGIAAGTHAAYDILVGLF